MTNCYGIQNEELEKRLRRRAGHGGENNVKIVPKILFGIVYWAHLDRFLTVMGNWVESNDIVNCMTGS
jgi:hypothetical protein